jgi:signal transduction histidine kinase
MMQMTQLQQTHTQHRPSPVHVIVVDDEPILREEAIEYLTGQGFNAEAISSGQAALARLRDDPSIMVMVTDVRMPEMDGLALAKAAMEIRDDEHALEIIVLTGHATLDLATKSVRLRTIDFLTKPLRLNNLKTAIETAAQAAAARRDKWRANIGLVMAHSDAVRQLNDVRLSFSQLQSEVDHAKEHDGQLRTAQQKFMSMINHELRTPLGPIIGYAELIAARHERLAPDDVRTYAQAIKSGGQRLERSVSRIVHLTELLSCTDIPRAEQCDGDRIVQMLARLHEPSFTARRQTLDVISRAGILFRGDYTNIRNLMNELLNNASRFSPEGSTIVLGVEQTSTDIEFQVADSGPGMTENEIAEALQPFRQLNMTLSRGSEGLGVGLPIASTSAELLGGRLSLKSPPGQGLVAVFSLPNLPV